MRCHPNRRRRHSGAVTLKVSRAALYRALKREGDAANAKLLKKRADRIMRHAVDANKPEDV